MSDSEMKRISGGGHGECGPSNQCDNGASCTDYVDNKLVSGTCATNEGTGHCYCSVSTNSNTGAAGDDPVSGSAGVLMSIL